MRTYTASWNSSAAKLNSYATVLIGYFNATNSVALPLGSSDASANSITLEHFRREAMVSTSTRAL